MADSLARSTLPVGAGAAAAGVGAEVLLQPASTASEAMTPASSCVERCMNPPGTLGVLHHYACMKKPDDSAAALAARDLACLWHPCTQMKDHERELPLIPVRSGSGVWLEGFDGRRYLDAVGSWWVNLFGHANPRINAAITQQLGELEHVMLAGFTHRPVIELSER